MSKFTNAMASAAALGLVFASTAASAEPVRASAALPGVVSVKKSKIIRSSAPAGEESNARRFYGADLAAAIGAAVAAGVGVYFIVRNDGDGAIVSDSPGG